MLAELDAQLTVRDVWCTYFTVDLDAQSTVQDPLFAHFYAEPWRFGRRADAQPTVQDLEFAYLVAEFVQIWCLEAVGVVVRTYARADLDAQPTVVWMTAQDLVGCINPGGAAPHPRSAGHRVGVSRGCGATTAYPPCKAFVHQWDTDHHNDHWGYSLNRGSSKGHPATEKVSLKRSQFQDLLLQYSGACHGRGGIPQAVAEAMRSEGQEAAQRLKDSREMTMNKMRDAAAGLSLGDLFFAWDAARSVEGYYRIKGCTEVGAKQALARSPYADTVGMGSGKLILSQARQFSAEVEAAVPHQMLAYNQCPSFNQDSAGMAGQQVETFIDEADGRGLGRQVRAGHRQLAHGRFSMRPHDVRLQFGGEHGALMIDAMEGLSHQKAACYIVLCTNSPSKHLAFGA